MLWAQECWGWRRQGAVVRMCSPWRAQTLIKESRPVEGLAQTHILPARSPARPKSCAELAQADSWATTSTRGRTRLGSPGYSIKCDQSGRCCLHYLFIYWWHLHYRAGCLCVQCPHIWRECELWHQSCLETSVVPFWDLCQQDSKTGRQYIGGVMCPGVITDPDSTGRRAPLAALFLRTQHPDHPHSCCQHDLRHSWKLIPLTLWAKGQWGHCASFLPPPLSFSSCYREAKRNIHTWKMGRSSTIYLKCESGHIKNASALPCSVLLRGHRILRT